MVALPAQIHHCIKVDRDHFLRTSGHGLEIQVFHHPNMAYILHNSEILVQDSHALQHVVLLVRTLLLGDNNKCFSQKGGKCKDQDQGFDPRDFNHNEDIRRVVALEEAMVPQELKLITIVPWLKILGKNWKKNIKKRKNNPADVSKDCIFSVYFYSPCSKPSRKLSHEH